jgi:hypothetical protein
MRINEVYTNDHVAVGSSLKECGEGTSGVNERVIANALNERDALFRLRLCSFELVALSSTPLRPLTARATQNLSPGTRHFYWVPASQGWRFWRMVGRLRPTLQR